MLEYRDFLQLKTEAFAQRLADGVIPWIELNRENENINDQQLLSDRLANLEAFIQNLDVDIYYGDSIDPDDLYPACYIGATDTIGMPYPVEFFPPEDHRSILDYYRILLHEIAHWTRHPERLNRKRTKDFNSKAYAIEELTVELAAVFILARFDITEPLILDQTEYVSKWQKIIALFDGDRFSMTTAELQAHKACDYLFNLQNAPS